jgi:hypothetical protein
MPDLCDPRNIKELASVVLDAREKHQGYFRSVLFECTENIFESESVFSVSRVHLNDCISGIVAVEFDLRLDGILSLISQTSTVTQKENIRSLKEKPFPPS